MDQSICCWKWTYNVWAHKNRNVKRKRIIAFYSYLGPLACPPDWFLNGSSCYKVSDIPGSWSDARQGCGASGGYLVKIDDNREQRSMVLYMQITGLNEVTNVSTNTYSCQLAINGIFR